LKRILRCHPWGEAGTDHVPLPEDKTEKAAG
ncbi:MAG TPA: membrane protein insertion efficiency factor YidD, partial [Rhodospirillales bacterium]|nr:membrane protein insertion efficiency factor YidD [Rhodospirillales bacterium]